MDEYFADFETEQRWQKEARKPLDISFYPEFSYKGQFVFIGDSNGSLWLQKNAHIDAICKHRQLGSITVEEKIISWKGWVRDSMMIETESDLCDPPKNNGWIYVSTADNLVYAYVQGDGSLVVWVFDLPKLRTWFEENKSRYTENIDTLNKSKTTQEVWTTRCKLVRLSHIPTSCIVVKSKRVEKKDMPGEDKQLGLFSF